MAVSSRVLLRLRRTTRAKATSSTVALALLLGAPGAGFAAQQDDGVDPERAALLARADSIRAEMAESRPPRRHPTDLVDVLTAPFQIVAAPINFVLVTVPSFVIGELTVPRPPGFVVRTLNDLREAGVHPGLAGSIGPRSGPAATLRFGWLDPIQLDGAFSVRGSQRYRLRARATREEGRVGLEAGARWQRDAQVAFYGIGSDAPDRQTLYRHETFGLALDAVGRPLPILELRAELGYEDNLVDEPLWAGDEPSLFEVFDPEGLFGADERLRFVRFGARGELDLTHRVGFQDRGVRLLAGATRFAGTGGTATSFHKVHFEGEGLVPLNLRQLVALQARTELTRGGGDRIPFYHLAGLGGETTAIGYPDTRFRDRDMLALTAEWRYEIWRDIHNSLRVESFLYFGEGAVAPRLGDIAARDWHDSYGFGFRVARTEALLGMVYLGFSDESAQFGVSGEWSP